MNAECGTMNVKKRALLIHHSAFRVSPLWLPTRRGRGRARRGVFVYASRAWRGRVRILRRAGGERKGETTGAQS
jgi:hypothetical protein